MTNALYRPFSNWWQFLAANVILSIAVMFLFWNAAFSNVSSFFEGFIWSFMISITQWVGNAYVAIKIDERVDQLTSPVKRAVYGGLGIVVYSSIAYVLVQVVMRYLFTDAPIPTDIMDWIKGMLYFVLPISFSVSFVFSLVGYYFAWRDSELKAQRLETEMLSYKYESLKNQINPHFLFNSFNVLSELVVEDQDLAVDFIQKMSDLYRYVLESKDKELVPLKEEVKFIKDYIFLLKTRFGDKIQVTWDLKADQDVMIVPMAMQLLIENVTKHNIATKAKPLHVSITQESDCILVTNNLQIKKNQSPSTQKGLRNLEQQYSFFTDLKVSIEQTTEEYKVSIPLILKA